MNQKQPMKNNFLETYAAQLEREHGPCVTGRAALLEWLDVQLDRLASLRAPGEAALGMISAAYVQWQAETIGMDPDEGC